MEPLILQGIKNISDQAKPIPASFPPCHFSGRFSSASSTIYSTPLSQILRRLPNKRLNEPYFVTGTRFLPSVFRCKLYIFCAMGLSGHRMIMFIFPIHPYDISPTGAVNGVFRDNDVVVARGNSAATRHHSHCKIKICGCPLL